MATDFVKVFTLRLSEDDAKKLESLKSMTRETTDAGTVKFVIGNYESLFNEMKKMKQEINELKFDLSKMNQKVYNFRQSFNSLMEKDE